MMKREMGTEWTKTAELIAMTKAVRKEMLTNLEAVKQMQQQLKKQYADCKVSGQHLVRSMMLNQELKG